MFGKKTVDSVMGQFNRVIKDLNEVAEASLSEVSNQDSIIEEATDKRAAALNEAERALDIRAKLESLVS